MGVYPGNILPCLRIRYGLTWGFLVVVLGLCGAGAAPARAALVINEFLADPSGSDGGREFVELLNTGDAPFALEGVALQFANGAVGPDWITRWRAEGLGSLAGGARFLLVDRNWQGEPAGDAEVYLGLQNGPDAIRLVVGTTVLDLVGYGALTDTSLFEGAPVALQAGLALARRPDGRDTDRNGSDFVSSAPTPGGANFAPYSVALLDLTREPAALARSGDTLRLTLSLNNDGTEPLPAGTCRLVWATGTVDSWWDGADPDRGQVLVFQAGLVGQGPVPLAWEYPIPGRRDTLRVPLGSVQVGPPDLRLNEVMPAPAAGQGEWVELQWLGDAPVGLDGYRVRDEDGNWADLPAVTMTAGEMLVMAQDSTALALWQQANRAAGGGDCGEAGGVGRVLGLAGWPSLNNTPPDGRLFADRVYLADPDGVVLDVVAWGGPHDELPERGFSLERIGSAPVNPGAANWAVCTALTGSTPGCVNSVSRVANVGSTASVLSVSPPILDRLAGSPAVHIGFVVPQADLVWEARVFNLWGDRVRDFGGGDRGAGPRELLWDGRDDTGRLVGPGAYLVWLVLRTSRGVVRVRETSCLVVR